MCSLILAGRSCTSGCKSGGAGRFASSNGKEPPGAVLSGKCCWKGLLEKDILEYGLLKFTKKGTAFFKRNHQLQNCAEQFI
jgi:hypothetical protein